MPRPHNDSGCSVQDCAGKFYGRGFCHKHYWRFMRGYDPHSKSRMEKTEAERFEEKVERITESGCWLWTGSLNNKGYGQFNGNYAHRKSYEMHVGPIPEGMNVLHRCDTPSCVRPSHLWAGSQLENIRDAKSKGRMATGARLPQFKHGRYCIAYR